MEWGDGVLTWKRQGTICQSWWSQHWVHSLPVTTPRHIRPLGVLVCWWNNSWLANIAQCPWFFTQLQPTDPIIFPMFVEFRRCSLQIPTFAAHPYCVLSLSGLTCPMFMCKKASFCNTKKQVGRLNPIFVSHFILVISPCDASFTPRDLMEWISQPWWQSEEILRRTCEPPWNIPITWKNRIKLRLNPIQSPSITTKSCGKSPYMVLKSNFLPNSKGPISSQVLDLFLRQRPVDGEFGQFPRAVALRTRARQPDLQSRGLLVAGLRWEWPVGEMPWIGIFHEIS